MQRVNRAVLLLAAALFAALCVLCGAREEAARTRQFAPIASKGAVSHARGGYLIDLNRADAQTLDMLPGIGEVLSARIVAYREENGDFASVDALDDVPGIGPATMESLRRFLTAE